MEGFFCGGAKSVMGEALVPATFLVPVPLPFPVPDLARVRSPGFQSRCLVPVLVQLQPEPVMVLSQSSEFHVTIHFGLFMPFLSGQPNRPRGLLPRVNLIVKFLARPGLRHDPDAQDSNTICRS